MAKPLCLPGVEEQRVLGELEIHLLPEQAQQPRWNRLVSQRAALLAQCEFGGGTMSLRSELSGSMEVALLGWSAAAWHLGPREEWLGWSEEQRRSRMHFRAQNGRFVVLADRTRYPNLGTRSVKLCLAQLAADGQAQHGHPLEAVENFVVNDKLVSGHPLQSSNLTLLGPTAGLGRVAEDLYVRHVRPKQLCMRLLQPQARSWLCAAQLPAPLRAYAKALPTRWDPELRKLASLREHFNQVR